MSGKQYIVIERRISDIYLLARTVARNIRLLIEIAILTALVNVLMNSKVI
jgi:hypothetical protein